MTSSRAVSGRLYSVVWYAALVVATVGAVAVGVRWWPEGWWLLGGGAGVLATVALVAAWRTTRERTGRPLGGPLTVVGGTVVLLGAVVASSTLLALDLSFVVRVVTFATGAQAFFLAVDLRLTGASTDGRVVAPVAGHATALVGSALVVGWGPLPAHPRAALLAYAVGFSLLAIYALWTRQHVDSVAPPRPNTGPRHWEGVLLVAVTVGVLSTSVVSFTAPPTAPVPHPVAWRIGGVAAGVSSVGVLATLAAPPAPPRVLRPLSGTVATVLQHAVTLVVLSNVSLLAVLLVVPETFPWLLGGYLGVLLVGVVLEYLMVVYGHHRLKRGDEEVPPLSPDAPVTVVVTAANEASVLPESLEYNLESLSGLQFVLVPAAKSTDGTVDVAREFRDRHPDRIRVVPGTTGSKAEDLNLAWDHVETSYAVVLDADETIGPEFVSRGLAVLRERPEVGVVQGRKVATYPHASPLARFVSADRRHSTWIEHPFFGDLFGASHFAGSGALLRREVPPTVDGWSPDTLTEDIDFTLRLYLQTDWRVAYVPEMVIEDLNPRTVPGLIRQRVRWARGWVQVAVRSEGDILRSVRRLGWRRTLGVSWLLFTAVSAPVYLAFPALLLLGLAGIGPGIPTVPALVLALVLLPARGVSIAYAALRDPTIPLHRTPARVAEMLVHAYLWIPFGWVVQLHALYLQLADAPSVWHVTQKTGGEAGDTRRRRGAVQTTGAGEAANAD